MKKFCTKCGKPFDATGREVICPACKEEAAAAAKRAAVERAKMRSYSGEACPVRVSARARGFIEAVAQAQGCKFIPALDEVLKRVCKDYGFQSWEEVPEHKTARRTSKTAGKPQEVKQDAQEVPQEVKVASKPQEVKAAKVAKTTSKASKKGERKA